MNTYGFGDNYPSGGLSRQQINVVRQLFRDVQRMYHIDELFQWLAYTIIQSFDIQLVQFWTNHINTAGQLALQMRMMARQDLAIPEQIMVNENIAIVARSIGSDQRASKPHAIESLVSPHQAMLLKRYKLNYCAGCLISTNLLLPPQGSTQAYDRSSAPLVLMALLFLRQSPDLDLVPTVKNILEQATVIAGNRGLLLPATGIRHSFTANTPPIQQEPLPLPQSFIFNTPRQQEPLPLFEELIPHRKQDANFMLTSNPFADTSVISDKQARRLHSAIDGLANIAQLCEATSMEIKDAYTALQKLLAQRRIEVRDPKGQLVDIAAFFGNRRDIR